MPPQIHPLVCPYDVTAVMAYYVDAPTPTLIDTGGASHPHGPIAAGLRERGVDLARIARVINTHGHWDHAGGNAAVHAASGATPVIHHAGAALLLGPAAHAEGYFTMAARVMEQTDQIATLRASLPAQIGNQVAPTALLDEGSELDFGGGVVLTALHVPGHSADMTAFYWAREGLLIAGDAAQGTGSRRGSCPLYFHSVREARASIARLREVPFATLHVSHPFGRLGTDERVAVYDRAGGLAFLDDSLAALDAMESALRAALVVAPEAPFPALARDAAARLQQPAPWPMTLDPVTGLPANAAPTLYHLWRDLRAEQAGEEAQSS